MCRQVRLISWAPYTILLGALAAIGHGGGTPRAARAGGARGSGDLAQAAGLDLVDEPAHGVLVRDERARLDPADRAAHVVVEVREGLRRPRRLDSGVLLEVRAEAVVGEREHAAVGVVDQHDLRRPQQALGDGQRADLVVGHHAAGVADDVRVAHAEPKDGVDVEARVHAGHHGEALGRGQRQVALVEALGVRLVVAQQLVGHAHGGEHSALDSAADARADRVPLARRGRGEQAEANRRVRRPGEHWRGAPERGPHALAGRLGRARPAARLRRVHAGALRRPARRARGRRARGAPRAGRALPGRGVGALLHAGGRGVRRGLPAGVLAGHRPPRRPMIGKAIGVVVHPQRDSTELIACVVRWAERHGCEVRGLHEARDLLPDSVVTVDEGDLARDGSLVIGLGGDGTILRALKLATEHAVPVLGVNLGRLAFLAEVNLDELPAALDQIDQGAYRLEPRATMTVLGELDALPITAFNDSALSRIPGHGRAALAVEVEGEVFARYTADALVIATPTGSTAFSFAAGGPIVSPLHRGLLVTPVAPHAAFDRAVFLHPEEELRVHVLERSAPLLLEADGQRVQELGPGDALEFCVTERSAYVVRLHDHGFYERARVKLQLTDSSELAPDSHAEVG